MLWKSFFAMSWKRFNFITLSCIPPSFLCYFCVRRRQTSLYSPHKNRTQIIRRLDLFENNLLVQEICIKIKLAFSLGKTFEFALVHSALRLLHSLYEYVFRVRTFFEYNFCGRLEFHSFDVVSVCARTSRVHLRSHDLRHGQAQTFMNARVSRVKTETKIPGPKKMAENALRREKNYLSFITGWAGI